MNSRGYGGRLSPPCRQLPNAPREHVSRAQMFRPGRKVFARPASRSLLCMLTGEDCRELANASPQSDLHMSEVRTTRELTRTRRTHQAINTLRCNINSAESLMGEISC
jgi:hypothetical protein